MIPQKNRSAQKIHSFAQPKLRCCLFLFFTLFCLTTPASSTLVHYAQTFTSTASDLWQQRMTSKVKKAPVPDGLPEVVSPPVVIRSMSRPSAQSLVFPRHPFLIRSSPFTGYLMGHRHLSFTAAVLRNLDDPLSSIPQHNDPGIAAFLEGYGETVRKYEKIDFPVEDDYEFPSNNTANSDEAPDDDDSRGDDFQGITSIFQKALEKSQTGMLRDQNNRPIIGNKGFPPKEKGNPYLLGLTPSKAVTLAAITAISGVKLAQWMRQNNGGGS